MSQDHRAKYQQMRQEDAHAFAVDIRRDRAEICIKALATPTRFKGKHLADFEVATKEQKKVRGAVSEYLEHWTYHRAHGTNLLMIGTVGTGKSFLSWIICQALANKGFSVRCITEAGLMEEWRGLFRDGGDERQWAARLIKLDFLAIDELAVFIGNEENRLSTMFRIIDGRYMEQRPTLISCNLTMKDLRQHLGDRISDRLVERCIPLAMSWPSYRKRRNG